MGSGAYGGHRFNPRHLMVFLVFVLFKIPLNINFIAACLTILGYSLNDTIVVYDRIRENRRLFGHTLATSELVNKSLNQSFTRSLMTTVTTVSAMAVVSVVALVYNVGSILTFSVPRSSAWYRALFIHMHRAKPLGHLAAKAFCSPITAGLIFGGHCQKPAPFVF
jgi:hypothetical protein